MSAVCDSIPHLGDFVYISVFEFVPESKKIDYYRRLGIPMSFLRAGVQSLIMNLLHFSSSEQTTIRSLFIKLIFTTIKI